MTSAPRSPDYGPVNTSRVLAWLAFLLAVGVILFGVGLGIHAARSEEGLKPVWVIVSTVTAKFDTDKHFQAYYNKEPGVPVFFETEADCKKMLVDKKGDFLANVWPKFVKVVKEHDATATAPRCDLLVPVPKDDNSV